MFSGRMTLMLVYEPVNASRKPRPLARILDDGLIAAAAVSALSSATEHARTLSKTDAGLGEIEMAEVEKLKTILSRLIPGAESEAPGSFCPPVN